MTIEKSVCFFKLCNRFRSERPQLHSWIRWKWPCFGRTNHKIEVVLSKWSSTPFCVLRFYLFTIFYFFKTSTVSETYKWGNTLYSFFILCKFQHFLERINNLNWTIVDIFTKNGRNELKARVVLIIPGIFIYCN